MWRPSWSCDLDRLNKLSFPHPMEAPYEIWLWLAKRFLRRCLKSVDDRRLRWRMDNRACLYYKLTYEPKGSGELKRWRHRFPHYKSMGAFCCHGNQSSDPIWLLVLNKICCKFTVIIHKYFDQIWIESLTNPLSYGNFCQTRNGQAGKPDCVNDKNQICIILVQETLNTGIKHLKTNQS